MNIHYQKRKNTDLFKSLEDSNNLSLSNTQNYIPIYKKFFGLNETNYNCINLNNKWYLTTASLIDKEEPNIFNCKIKNITTNKTKDKTLFFKTAPLLDPYKYLIGKYSVKDSNLFQLPNLLNEKDCHVKFTDLNNAAYVDGLFVYFTDALMHAHNFPHGLEYYGSFLGIKNNFKLNVYDDLEYLHNSDFFNKNKNELFTIDNYDHLFEPENKVLVPIKIEHNISSKSNISIKSFDNELFENVFEENMLNLNDLKDMSIDLIDITNDSILQSKDFLKEEYKNSVSLKSGSTCSSRTSHTDEDEENEENEDEDDIEDCKNEEDEWVSDDEDDEEDEEIIEATIPKFPVQVICMENCKNTFDDLILNKKLKPEEMLSAFMQIIMILITYQKAFAFTHNDLHTNNVMYNHTEQKYLYYCYRNKYYKVPTFGRVYKIIDFGRSIYKFDGKLFCSDSFQTGGDAVTQYNTEPYLNEKRPRLEPNYSFDLCRLACSIFDYVIDDMDEARDLNKCTDPVKRLIFEWCLDDKGTNMLYKNNGEDRYPEFKLYKMIARCVHNHIPQAQLERPEFMAYLKLKEEVANKEIIDIDKIPSYV